MPLTPLDIHNKEFGRGFRGYDEDQVNEFLDQLSKIMNWSFVRKSFRRKSCAVRREVRSFL